MENRKLIEIVRQYKHLYDFCDEKYSDNQKKDQTWNEIGTKLKRNGKQCKKAWALLRDTYRRTIRKRNETKGEQSSVVERKWKYEEEMSFLLPYMQRRAPICTSETVPDCDSEYDVIVQEIAMLSEDEDDQQTSTFPSTSVSQQIGDPLTTAKRPTINYPLQKQTKPDQPQPPDDLEIFMTGITSTLRSFPARDRAIAKAKIFGIVSQIEIEVLSRPSTSDSVCVDSTENI